MTKDNTTPRVRRTQAEIVADLKAKAAAAEAKLQARQRKGFDTLHASYAKHIDAAVAASNVAREELIKLDAMAEELGIDKATLGLGFNEAGSLINILENGELVAYDFGVTEDTEDQD